MRGTTGGNVGWIVAALVANCVVMRLLIEFYQLWYLGLALPVLWYGPSCALMYSGAWGGGALASWLRGGRTVLMAGLGTLVIAFGLFVHDPRVVVGAQVATIFGVTVLNIALTRYLHDAMPSTVRAGASSVVSTIGYGAFVPTALGFGVYSRVPRHLRGVGVRRRSPGCHVLLGRLRPALAGPARPAARPGAHPATAGPGPAPGTSPRLLAGTAGRARPVQVPRRRAQRPLLVAGRPGPSASRARAEGEPGRGASEVAGVQGMAAIRAPGGWSRDRLGRQRGAGPAAARGP